MNRDTTIRVLFGLVAVLILETGLPPGASANPYLAKPGEKSATIRVATCAASGGFMHLYAAVDHGLFDKYGIKVEHVYIRGSHTSLAALASNEIQFLYCAADATIPGMATGVDAKLVGAPLVGLPYVLLTRKDIKKPEDLRGKSIGITTPGDLTHRLSKAMLKKFHFTERDVTLRPLGGSQPERYNAMVQDVVQAIPITPPLDVRGRKDGFNVIYNLNDLDLPFIYSSLHTNSKSLRDPQLVQRFVAAMAESIYFVEKNPDKAKASVGRVLKLTDQESLDSSYNAYAKTIINRKMIVPADAVEEAIDLARESGTNVVRKPADLFDNTFAEHLDKSGFLRQLWGGNVSK